MKASEDIEKQIIAQQQVIDYDTREFTIEYIVDKYNTGVDEDNNEIYVPDYQRDFVWDELRQSKLIESIILGLPIPLIFLAENKDNDNRLEIVDGSQRIRTLAGFIQDDLKLTGLESLKVLNGLKFSDLSPSRQRKIRNTPLRMIVLSDKATEEIRNEIFERINRGSDLLQAMEKRKGIYRGVFSDFIYEICAKDKLFNKLVHIDNRQAKRQEKEELILRFYALKEAYNTFPPRMGIAKYLDNYLERMNREFEYLANRPLSDYLEDKKLKEYFNEFKDMLVAVDKYFEFGFSKNHTPQVSRVFFEAISVGTYLALRNKNGLKTSREQMRKWINSVEFKTIISGKYHTHTPQRLKQRIMYVKEKLSND